MAPPMKLAVKLLNTSQTFQDKCFTSLWVEFALKTKHLIERFY